MGVRAEIKRGSAGYNEVVVRNLSDKQAKLLVEFINFHIAANQIDVPNDGWHKADGQRYELTLRELRRSKVAAPGQTWDQKFHVTYEDEDGDAYHYIGSRPQPRCDNFRKYTARVVHTLRAGSKVTRLKVMLITE